MIHLRNRIIAILLKVAADADVADMYEQYEGLIENFKAVHKECEAVKSSGYR